MSSIYHKKYLKYKQKYLELKQQIGGDYILDTSGNKCAEIVSRNEGRELFITDIKVHRDFAGCNANFMTILGQIETRARTEGKIVTLEDNSFMQFPEKYTSDDDALYKWDLAFVKNGGLSLYETYGFTLNLNIDTDVERTFLQRIRDLTTTYNTTNTFNLLNEGKKLEISRRVIAGETECRDPTKCYTDRRDYENALAIFDREYRSFDRYLLTNLLPYVESKEWKINGDDDKSWMREFVKSYHSLIKVLELNMYKKVV
jgi:hypothetical protein